MFWIIICIVIAIVIFAISKSGPAKSNNGIKRESSVISTIGKDTLLFDLTGVHISERFTYISAYCKQHDSVTLEFEPTNKFDKNAIMVLHGGVLIGYVPSIETDDVKDFITKYEYFALIYKKEFQADGYLYIEIGLIEK